MLRWHLGLLWIVTVLTVVKASTNQSGIDNEIHSSKMESAFNGGCVLQEKSLRLLLIGDSGGLPVWPYYTWAQTKVRDTMITYATEKNVQLVWNLGDNIYFYGVTDEFDSRFQGSFEKIYKDLNIPFFMIAGNHDHYGNASAQIAYTKHSDKWKLPYYYYKLRWILADGTTIDVLMLDTIVLCGYTADDEQSLLDMFFHKSVQPDGPLDEEAAEKQWNWIEKNLNNSRADYLFVTGHYPVYSLASHGPTVCLIDKLQPMLQRYKVSGYLAGHDHTLQHIIVNDINYIVSGASSRTDRSTANEYKLPKGSLKYHSTASWNPLSQLGFSSGALIYTEVNAKGASFTFLNGNGDVKYSTLIKPRKR